MKKTPRLSVITQGSVNFHVWWLLTLLETRHLCVIKEPHLPLCPVSTGSCQFLPFPSSLQSMGMWFLSPGLPCFKSSRTRMTRIILIPNSLTASFCLICFNKRYSTGHVFVSVGRDFTSFFIWVIFWASSCVSAFVSTGSHTFAVEHIVFNDVCKSLQDPGHKWFCCEQVGICHCYIPLPPWLSSLSLVQADFLPLWWRLQNLELRGAARWCGE